DAGGSGVALRRGGVRGSWDRRVRAMNGAANGRTSRCDWGRVPRRKRSAILVGVSETFPVLGSHLWVFAAERLACFSPAFQGRVGCEDGSSYMASQSDARMGTR